MSVPMTSLSPGQQGTVLNLGAAGSMRRRLLDLGILPGASVERVLDSAAGDPVCFRVRGALIALRNADAGMISVLI